MGDWSESIRNVPLQQVEKLYLYYHSIYGYQTWQGGDLPWSATTHKITLTFDQVVLQFHDKN